MHDPFDPYWQWLAIPPAEQPPDHYRLLGLRLSESDGRIIARAAESRIDQVRACDDGLHRDSVQQLLEHVAAARDTLLNPTLKAQYDNLLRQKQSARGPAESGKRKAEGGEGQSGTDPLSAFGFRPSAFPAVSSATPPPIVSGGGTVGPGVSLVAKRNQKAGEGSPSPISLLVCGIAAALVVVLGLMLWSSSGGKPAPAPSSGENGGSRAADRSGRQRASSPQPVKNASRVERTSPSHDHANSPGDRGERTSSSPSVGRGSPDPVLDGSVWRPAITAEDRGSGTSSPGHATVRRPRGPETMADLMHAPDDTAMETRTITGKLAAARRAMWSRDLATARGHVEAAVEAARTSTEQAEAQRVRKLLESLEAFWAAVREAAGQNVTGRVEDLPQRLAVALAEQSLPEGQAATDLCIGSFLAIDARGDRHEARTRWDRAGADGKALLLELTLAPPPQPAESQGPMRSGVPHPAGSRGQTGTGD